MHNHISGDGCTASHTVNATSPQTALSGPPSLLVQRKRRRSAVSDRYVRGDDIGGSSCTSEAKKIRGKCLVTSETAADSSSSSCPSSHVTAALDVDIRRGSAAAPAMNDSNCCRVGCSCGTTDGTSVGYSCINSQLRHVHQERMFRAGRLQSGQDGCWHAKGGAAAGDDIGR